MRKLAVLFAVLLSACASGWSPARLVPSQLLPAPAAAAEPTGQALVAAAHPLAAEAGMEVLRRGGTAVDAAVAIQGTLGLVEPQSSGIGGGAFLMVYDASSRKVSAYNGRETAPAGATPDMFLDDNGQPLPFAKAVVSGRATGVPGAVAMLALAQKQHGRLAWSSLFDTPVRLAAEGFTVTPRLDRLVHGRAPENSRPDVIAYFTRPDGKLVETGDRLRNPDYAATLRRLAAEGPSALYEGPIAEAIVAKTREAPLAGTMTLADLKAYRALQVDPLCRPWRIYVVCVPPPPSSGVSLLQALKILERTDIADRGPGDARGWFLLAEGERLMYADRDRYVADPAKVSVPVEGMLDDAYVASRAALIGDRAGPPPAPGRPRGAAERAPDRTLEPAGTTHFVVRDRWGNVASMTTTVESLFGSGRMVGGFFLNNQLTDFSFTPWEKDRAPAANAVGPRKRPRSSMSPIIVLDRQGRVVAALGSPGGSAILSYNLKTLVGVIDWELPMQRAIDLPNLMARGDAFNGEAGKFPPELLAGLRERGVEVKPGAGEESGLHGFILRGGRYDAGADPRREGVVLVWPES
jgi:gamma-glutamyltranspeptidase/glutathione hydrolase